MLNHCIAGPVLPVLPVLEDAGQVLAPSLHLLPEEESKSWLS